jgi:pyruvate carboxylase subunit A
MIRRLLIANRGEIAIRVARTAREMGIVALGVYSEADRDGLHRRAMDESFSIGGRLPAESYLNIESILRTARRERADAIHPGYGFLSESPVFARRCEDEGLIFVGPGPKAMALSGDKIASRKKMSEVGVPVTAGVDHVLRDADEAGDVAEGLGYPVIFKATAGGGGIGMSRVDRAKDLRKAFEAARSVALANFGNPDLFLEKYVSHARHIEVQVLLGRRGRGVHLGERECSVQRRHQKLIEETPSPALTPKTREKIGDIAVRGLRSIGYVNAGTVEFLYRDGRFTFNEVNARLQVEHPITEMVTGVDLVRQQILIAAGEAPEVSQSEIAPHGCAMECRINAEDPLRNFMPSPGRIIAYREPAGHGVRVDSGVVVGSTIPSYYDPLMAKLIVRGRTRGETVRRMERALREYEIRGVKTSMPFHQAILAEPKFKKGDLWTTMIADLRIVERLRSRGVWEERVAAIAAALMESGKMEAFLPRLPLQGSATHAWALVGRKDLHAGGDHAVSPRRRW